MVAYLVFPHALHFFVVCGWYSCARDLHASELPKFSYAIDDRLWGLVFVPARAHSLGVTWCCIYDCPAQAAALRLVRDHRGGSYLYSKQRPLFAHRYGGAAAALLRARDSGRKNPSPPGCEGIASGELGALG